MSFCFQYNILPLPLLVVIRTDEIILSYVSSIILAIKKSFDLYNNWALYLSCPLLIQWRLWHASNAAPTLFVCSLYMYVILNVQDLYWKEKKMHFRHCGVWDLKGFSREKLHIKKKIKINFMERRVLLFIRIVKFFYEAREVGLPVLKFSIFLYIL